MKRSLLLTICMDDSQQNPEGTVDDYFSLAKQWIYPVVIVNLFFQLVLKMGNHMNKGNTRIGSAAAFKIEYLNKVRWNFHNLLSLCFLLFISSFSFQDFAKSVENVNSTISRFLAWLQHLCMNIKSAYPWYIPPSPSRPVFSLFSPSFLCPSPSIYHLTSFLSLILTLLPIHIPILYTHNLETSHLHTYLSTDQSTHPPSVIPNISTFLPPFSS